MNLFKYVEGLIEEHRGAHKTNTADEVKAELARVVDKAEAEATARIADVASDVTDPQTPQERKDEAAKVTANIQDVIAAAKSIVAGERDVAVSTKK